VSRESLLTQQAQQLRQQLFLRCSGRRRTRWQLNAAVRDQLAALAPLAVAAGRGENDGGGVDELGRCHGEEGLLDLAQLDALTLNAGGRPLMAHTRMQVALPTTWGAKLASWSEPLQRHVRALAAIRRTLLVIQLGGPVGDRGSFEGHGDTIAAGLARRLDLGLSTPWHAARDPIVGLGSLLALISGSLGKLGADVTLLAQNEVAALRLEGGGGSSAMAHKSNPVNAEVLIALARFNAGLAGTLQQAMVHENERSGSAWTLEWLTLPPMLITTGASLRLGRELLDQIRLT